MLRVTLNPVRDLDGVLGPDVGNPRLWSPRETSERTE